MASKYDLEGGVRDIPEVPVPGGTGKNYE